MSEATAVAFDLQAAAKKAVETGAIDPKALPEDVRVYEAMWLVDSNQGREQFGKVIEALKEIVEKAGACWINGDKWDERRLMYPIKKKKRALYVLSHFIAKTESLNKVERNASISDLILRHLIVRDEDGLSLIMTQRGPEDDLDLNNDRPERRGGPGGGDRRGGGSGTGGRGGRWDDRRNRDED